MGARSGIENTLYLYAWAYDMDELDRMGKVFATDAEVEFQDSGLKVGREAVVTEMRRRREKYLDGSIPWHVISNILIENETASKADVKSFWTFYVKSPDGGSTSFKSIGYYDDVFVLEDGVWRVHRRRVTGAGQR